MAARSSTEPTGLLLDGIQHDTSGVREVPVSQVDREVVPDAGVGSVVLAARESDELLAIRTRCFSLFADIEIAFDAHPGHREVGRGVLPFVPTRRIELALIDDDVVSSSGTGSRREAVTT